MPLWNEIVYGPIRSRRLGMSLGVNLLPTESKVCSFNCIYCECGWNRVEKGGKMPTLEEYEVALENRLQKMKAEGGELNVITFAGNGEPTLHPQFVEVIDVTIRLRDVYFPNAKVSVLSNATQLGNQKVVEALHKVDNNILKIDSAIDDTLKVINQPNEAFFGVERLEEGLHQFEGECVIQTLFFKGRYRGVEFDNTTDVEVNAWLKVLKCVNPREVMIYSLDRATPAEGLERPSIATLHSIAKRVEELGIKVSVTE